MQLKQAVAGKAFIFLLPRKGILYLGERASLHFCQLYGVLDQGFYINLFVFPVHSQKVWLVEQCREGGPGGLHSDPPADHAIPPITNIPGGRHYNRFFSSEELWSTEIKEERF